MTPLGTATTGANTTQQAKKTWYWQENQIKYLGAAGKLKTTGLSFGVNTAAKPDAAYVFMNETANTLSNFLQTSSMTKSIDFSSAFKNNIGGTAYTATTALDMDTAATAISGLAKDIFNTTVGASGFKGSKTTLMNQLKSAISGGANSTSNTLNTLKLANKKLDEAIKAKLAAITKELEEFFKNYNSLSSLSGIDYTYGVGSAASAASAATSSTGTTTTPATSIATGTTTDPATTDPATTPATPVTSVITDPNVLSLMSELQNDPYMVFYASGTSEGFDEYAWADMNGLVHNVNRTASTNWGTDFIDYKYESNPTSYSNIVNQGVTATIKDQSGNAYQYKSEYNETTYAEGTGTVTIDGQQMDSAQFESWLAGKNFKTETIDYWGQSFTVYKATVETQYGQHETMIAATDGSKMMGRAEAERSFVYEAKEGYYKNAGGGYTYISLPGEFISNGITINGSAATAQDVVDWAKNNAVEVKTFDVEGTQVKQYFGEIVTASGIKKASIAGEVDGKAVLTGESRWSSNVDDYKLVVETPKHYETTDSSGNTNEVRISNIFLRGEGPYTIEKQASVIEYKGQTYTSVQEKLALAKAEGFTSKTISYDGEDYTNYYVNNSQGSDAKFVASEKNGVASAVEYSASSYQMKFQTTAGNEIAIDVDTLYGENTDIKHYSFNGQEIAFTTAQEKLDFAKANNVAAESFNYNGKTMNLYLSASYGSFVTEIDGVVSEENYFFNYGTANYYSDEGGNAQLAASVTYYWLYNPSYQNVAGKAVHDGQEISLDTPQQLLDFAKEHDIRSETFTQNDKTATVYYKYSGVTKTDSHGILAAEIDGKAVSVKEYFLQMGFYSPVTLDLDNNGIQGVAMEQGVEFDLTGSGQKVQTGWVAGGDALLALDRDKSGAIESGKELFGNQHGAANGYAELAKFDTNKDNKIDAQDAVYNDLRLWQDKNQNGISEADELTTLKEQGVKSLNLEYTETSEENAGNEIRQKSTFTREDGTAGNTVDIWFKYTAASKYIKGS